MALRYLQGNQSGSLRFAAGACPTYLASSAAIHQRACCRRCSAWGARRLFTDRIATVVVPSPDAGPSTRSKPSSSTKRRQLKTTLAATQRYAQSNLIVSTSLASGKCRAAATSASNDPENDSPLEDNEIPPEVEQLFGTLRDEALRRLDEFGPIHLFSLCWAYSTARLLDDTLERHITTAALKLGRQRDREPLKVKKDRRGALATTGNTSVEHLAHAHDAAQQEGPTVLAEHEHWMAIYKPPFWQVSVDSKEATKAAASLGPFEEEADDGDGEEGLGTEESRKKPRIQKWVQQNFFSKHPIHNDALEAFGLMHRLDIQTSGILMCAKSYVGAYWLRLQWASYAVDKEYVCLVHGWVDKSIREVHARIRVDKKKAPDSRRTLYTICSVSDSGKPAFSEVFTLAHLTRACTITAAETSTETSEQLHTQKYSLVALKLHTGRTHQIRVHMMSLGHPLVCDVKYAEDMFPADRAWCPRNFLHTYHFGFNDVPAEVAETTEKGEARDSERAGSEGSPECGGRPVNVFCPVPSDLRRVLACLEPADDMSAKTHAEWVAGDDACLRPFDEYTNNVAGSEAATSTNAPEQVGSA
eukprot:TRINITY_DN11866_c0_g1_i1.p1 TRINITY_DN11866_c0_g1~~TRINITY_DN11866_c0_g1_i1.p1  ORF type:complete len:586 (+),score=69.08 TRINITY_DN11866_c0_g1_i1:67-1824(+)